MKYVLQKVSVAIIFRVILNSWKMNLVRIIVPSDDVFLTFESDFEKKIEGKRSDFKILKPSQDLNSLKLCDGEF